MRTRVSRFILPALAAGIACVQPVNTVPPPVAPTDAVQYYDLEIPSDLDIKSVDFSASTFADVTGTPETATSSTVGGRAFVKVYAVHRTSGDQYLLLYEDVANRKRPVQIIRFVRGAIPARPDSTR
jgi:hypothetical protein